MIDPFWLSLLVKMAASAGIVVVASLVVERAGPFLGAMVATLPISAGPAYAFLAYEHGPAFIERSSLASLAVNAATVAYIVIYAGLAQRRSLAASLGIALALWLLAAWLVTQVAWTLVGAVALNAVTFAACWLVGRSFRTRDAVKKVVPGRWWDIPARAFGVMCLVLIVILAGRLLGPTIAGIAALAPIVLTSLALVLHSRMGGPATASMFVNAVPGMIGFAAALIVLNVTVVPLGSMAALMIALAVCVCWNAGLVLLRR